MQRAVRYLRHHAEEYGIDPNKIGLIGFSAGGFEVASFINQIQGNSLFMGHAEIGTTMNVYAHVNFDDAKDEIRKLNIV